MGFILFMTGVLVVVALIASTQTDVGKAMANAPALNRDNLRSLVDEKSEEGIEFISYNSTFGIVLNEESRQIHAFYAPVPEGDQYNQYTYEYWTCNLDDILESEVVIDDTSITKSMRGRQVGGAVVGGALLGGVGAIVGGLSGGTKSEKRIHNIEIKLTINDLQEPVQKINFLNTREIVYENTGVKKGFETDREEYVEAIKSVERWQGMFDVIMRSQSNKT